jgi:hypothetical protein
VLGIDEGGETAILLGAGDDVKHQSGFAGGLRPENFHDASTRQTADAQRKIDRQAPRGNHVYLYPRRRVAQSHDAALAVSFGDGGNRRVEIAVPRRLNFVDLGRLGLGGSRFFNGFLAA